jgi:hypothetical protein
MHFQVIFARESALQRSAMRRRTGAATCLTIRQSARAVHESKTKGELSQIAVRFR